MYNYTTPILQAILNHVKANYTTHYNMIVRYCIVQGQDH